MKPLSIEFQAFGPYAGYEKVDFEAIASEGLFLICGKTGTGKTMILDAMTFALYGKGSGKARDEFDAMRCTRADFDAVTFVKFIFENNGEYYCFERRLERKRKNLSPSYNASRRDENGNWIPLFENAKKELLNAKAVEIIGLEYDQFRQVIVLPQGQFEKLLTSDSSEKEKILTSIFGEERWRLIAENMFVDAKERMDELKKSKDMISSRLLEEGCETIAQLLLFIEQKEQELADLKSDYEGKNCDEVIRKMNASLAIVKRFGDLSQAELNVTNLESQKASYEELRAQREVAQRAESLRPLLDKADAAKKDLVLRANAETSAAENSGKAETLAKSAVKALADHVAAADTIEKKKEQKALLDAKRSDYEQIDAVSKELETAKNLKAKAEKDEADAKASYEKLVADVEAQDAVIAETEAECERLTDQYFADVAFEIAGSLEEGKACPVCGSTTHPHCAVAAEETVTKQAVAAKREEVKKEKAKKDSLEASKEKAKSLYEEKQKEVMKKSEAVIEFGTKLENVKANLAPGIDDLAALEEIIFALKEEIETYEELRGTLEADEKAKKEALTTAKTTYEHAVKEHSAAKKAVEDAALAVTKGLSEKNFASEEEARSALLEASKLDELRNKIAQYDANVKASGEVLEGLKKELTGVQKPDAENCREQLTKATEEKSEYEKASGSREGEICRLKDKYDSLMKLGEGLEESIREAEEDLALARKLRGETGIGLQRYVLGIMFSSVVTAANKMLEMVHGGRYRLFRSDDKGQGNKRGLELKVHDQNSMEHEGRFVNTLSGGEKFLASLALSIGMSTVAQKSGIKIEALFIDEGFGSLDEDSINDAMDILQSIKNANGLVGIISHVKILQDHIGTKLRVEEDESGSRIMQTIG